MQRKVLFFAVGVAGTAKAPLLLFRFNIETATHVVTPPVVQHDVRTYIFTRTLFPTGVSNGWQNKLEIIELTVCQAVHELQEIIM